MAESLLVSNSDVLFMILSLLPAETLLQVKSVCRAWARAISDPAFARAHSSRPAPVTSIFTIKLLHSNNRIQGFKPFQQGAKFPKSIWGILSIGFRAVSGSYGLLCFHRDSVFIVGNPATSHWSVLHSGTPDSLFMYRNAVLIYDPAISTHFKLAVALLKSCSDDLPKLYIKFSIYSSETSLWADSPLFTQGWNSEIFSFHRGSEASLCWIDETGTSVGYEISSGAYWRFSKPPPFDKARYEYMSNYNSTILFARMSEDVTKVWRLGGKDSWVLEGEGGNEELRSFAPVEIVYDCARGAMIKGGRRIGEYVALHLSSSRLEILSQGGAEFSWQEFDFPEVLHANTLAPFHGAVTGLNGLAREFHRMGLAPIGNLEEE